MKIRSKLGVALLGISLFTGSCLGPNKTFNSMHEWNDQATEQDWVNETIFLGLTILPVYSLVYLFDIVVLNTIDYWSDDKDGE